MDAEELDYSDEELKGDINTEEENSLLGTTSEDANKPESNEYLELDCPEEYQEEDQASAVAEQNSTAVEEKTPSQKGKSPQIQEQNQKSNPKTNRQSRNKNKNNSPQNIKNKYANMRKNNNKNFQQRRSNSRSRSQPFNNKNQNRDFNSRFPARQQPVEAKQFHGSPWMPNADPNLRQSTNALVATVLPRVATSNITQRALHQQNLHVPGPTIQEVITNLAMNRDSNSNITRTAVQFPAASAGFNSNAFDSSNRSLLRPVPGVSTSFNNREQGARAIPEIPSLLDSRLLPSRREPVRAPADNNKPHNPNFQRNNERRPFGNRSSSADNFRSAQVNTSTPKALIDNDLRRNNFHLPSGSNISSFDVSLKPAFESRGQNNFNKNNVSTFQNFHDSQDTRPDTNFQNKRNFKLDGSRFMADNSNVSAKNDADYDNYDYDNDYNFNFRSNSFTNKNDDNSNSNNNNNNNRNNNFRRNSRVESNNFRSNNNNNTTNKPILNDRRADEFHSEGQNPENNKKFNNKNRNKYKNDARNFSPVKKNIEEPKPQINVPMPEITPEDKELVLQKKQERLQRFSTQTLVNYEVSSQSSLEWTLDQGECHDNLEIDEEYLKGMEEQKRRREEIMKQKLLKRKLTDNSSMSDIAESKPYKKPNVAKREALDEKRNPFGEFEMDIGDIKQEDDVMERNQNARYNGQFPNKPQTMTTRPLSARSMEEIGGGGNTAPLQRQLSFPDRNIPKQPEMPRAKSPHPGRNKSYQPMEVDGFRPKSPHPSAYRTADEGLRAKSPHPCAYNRPVDEGLRPKSPHPSAYNRPVDEVPRPKSPYPLRVGTSRPVDEMPSRPKSPYPRSTSQKFVLTDDMLPIQKTIFNEYAHSYHGSDASSSHTPHFDDNVEEPASRSESVFNGCIIKILNFPPTLGLDYLRKMCAPFGQTLEVKLNSPRENSAGIRFAVASSAEAFYKRYHRDNIGGTFLPRPNYVKGMKYGGGVEQGCDQEKISFDFEHCERTP